MRVVVTGGSGQLGTHVLRRLIDMRKVKRIVSLDVHPPAVVSGKLEAIEADVRDPDVGRHMEGADALVHLAFIVTSKAPRELFDAVNVEGSKNVFRAAAEKGLKTIVYTSSVAQYGGVDGHPIPIVETTPRVHQPDFAYSSAKFRVEEHLDVFEREHPGVRIVRLRPAILIGTHFQNPLAKVFGKLLDRGIMPETSSNSLPIVWDEDVADAVILSLTSEARGAFNLGSREPKTASELASAAGLRLVKPPELLLDAATMVGSMLEKVAKLEVIDPAWQKNGDVTMVMDSEKARRELGWKPTADTAVDVVRRYREDAPGRMDRRISAFFSLLGRLAESDESQKEQLARMHARVHLRLTGRGGGDVTLEIMNGRFTVKRGIPRPPTSVVTITTSLFREMLAGKSSFATAELTGRVKIQGEFEAAFLIGGMIRRLEIARKQEGMRGQVARLFSRWLEGGAS